MMLVMGHHLREIDPAVPLAHADDYARRLGAAMLSAEINTELRQAAFLAQVLWESCHLQRLEEMASGSAYEGRIDLGNTCPGYGVRYKGRGWMMLSGQKNYAWAERVTGLPLLEWPELAAHPDNAALIAAKFWTEGAALNLSRKAKKHLGDVTNLNVLADNRDFDGVTMAINGDATPTAPSYQIERVKLYECALQVLRA